MLRRVKIGCRAIFVGGVLLCVVALRGCSCDEGKTRATIYGTRNSDLAIAVSLERCGDPDRPSFLAFVSIENLSAGPVTVYDGPNLPTILHEPPDCAIARYGLLRLPSEWAGSYEQTFDLKVLPGGKKCLYAFVLQHRLQESGIPNPYYDVPYGLEDKSPRPLRRPDILLWKRWKLCLNYFPGDLIREQSLEHVSDTSEIQSGGMAHSLLELQREITLEAEITGL